MQAGLEGRVIRFGSFEAYIEEGRLTKGGVRIRLQDQPFHILVLLLERAGQIVTREEIRQELWAQDTFVDFDKALNTAVGKLRAALCDSADNPRFLETVPRRGYRFVAPVTFPAQPPIRTGPVSVSPALPATGSKVGRDAAPSAEPGRQSAGWRSPLGWALVGLLVVAAGLGIYWSERRPIFHITARDTIVLADFVNTTGEGVFDDALRQGLEIGLEQSPFVKVLPERSAWRILRQMGNSPDQRITGKIAIELCQRASGKVTVQGSIASLGSAYLVGLAAIRCDNGEPIANEQVQVKRKEDVVDALGNATARLRSRLGESLPSIERYNAPLEQATTASIDALNAYGLALSTWDKKGDRSSLPIFQSAVALDPNFAQAYGALATVYHNVGEHDLARENASKAYELRARVTEAERATIEARYYAYVTGELEKVAEVRTLEVQNYPESAGAYNHLGDVDGELGHYEQSVQDFRKAMLLDPTRANTYYNIAYGLLAQNRLDDASLALTEAAQRKLQSEALLQANYWVAFLRGDTEAMQRVLQQSLDVAGAQPALLFEQSNSEAYHGRYEKARELSRKASDLTAREGDKELAASFLAQAGVRDSEIGDSAQAREFISQAQALSRGKDVVTLSALSMARSGNLKQAEVLVQGLDQQWPVGTFVQKYWLPVIRAEIDLQRGRPSKAVDDLGIATSQLELGVPTAMAVASLYPAYVRGQAYLAAGDGRRALAEFQKFADHKDLIVNSPLGPLARLGLARSLARSGDTQKARQAYQEFLDLWKDADPSIPLLKEARAEYAKLN